MKSNLASEKSEHVCNVMRGHPHRIQQYHCIINNKSRHTIYTPLSIQELLWNVKIKMNLFMCSVTVSSISVYVGGEIQFRKLLHSFSNSLSQFNEKKNCCGGSLVFLHRQNWNQSDPNFLFCWKSIPLCFLWREKMQPHARTEGFIKCNALKHKQI